MKKNASVTVIVPCFNEEGNIQETMREIENALNGLVSDYEVLIFNDCSTDRTKDVVDAIAKTNPRVKVTHNLTNRGLGFNYRKGVELASKEYVIMVPGDNEVSGESIRTICEQIGKADIVIPYIENYTVRPLHRQGFSRAFTLLVNAITGFRIHYYNGPVLHRTTNLRSIELRTNGFAYQAEILVQLLRKKSSYIQVPMQLRPRSYGSSRAFDRKNILSVARTLLAILLRVS